MPKHKTASTDGLWNLVLSSRSETESLGRAIGNVLEGGEVLALIGELGAGKTALIRGIAEGLQAPPFSVSSPTFVLIHEYRARLPLIHVDLYRLRTDAEFESIGLSDYFAGQTVTAIEWADRFLALLPEDRLEIHLSHRSPATRRVRLTGHGPQSLSLMARISQTQRLPRQMTAADQPPISGRRKALER